MRVGALQTMLKILLNRHSWYLTVDQNGTFENRIQPCQTVNLKWFETLKWSSGAMDGFAGGRSERVF